MVTSLGRPKAATVEDKIKRISRYKYSLQISSVIPKSEQNTSRASKNETTLHFCNKKTHQ